MKDYFQECVDCPLPEWLGCTACENKAYWDCISRFIIPMEEHDNDHHKDRSN